MKLPVSMEPSPSPAAQRRAQPGPLRVLVVAGEGSGALLQSLRQWAPDLGVDVEAAPDLPRAVRQLAAQRWDVVLVVLGERADDDVTWWVDALRGAAGSPQLLTAAHRPSMGLVLRAEKLGVLDLLSLPVRRETCCVRSTACARSPPRSRSRCQRRGRTRSARTRWSG